MLITTDIEHKSIGNKLLFVSLKLAIEQNEKVAIIGRNGVGKTTLFGMLTGQDNDFAGSITTQPGARIVATAQEHHGLGQQTLMQYIITQLPEYKKLQQIIDSYPATMGDDMRKITIYSDALERFSQLDYYNIDDRIRQSLEAYQLGAAANEPMASLSGGQKRFVELIRVEHSAADLALIDEPTNHMDYVAKATFLKWFSSVKHAVVVITHDRDLLAQVSRIIEIKDQTTENFRGNYSDYLKQNTARTANDLNEYDTVQRRITNLKKQINAARAKKASTSKTPNPFVVIENRLLKELSGLERAERPTFWIDQESVGELRPKVEASYQKHKAKTIHIRRFTASERQRELLHLEQVQVGYDKPLFAPLNMRVISGDRFQLVGRNGAGKTTLVKTILGSLESARSRTLLHGIITADSKLRINYYEQEIDQRLLDMTLGTAIEALYDTYGAVVSSEKIMRVLSDFLFDPYADREQLVQNLSGGQKARLQLIKLFANDPNLIIIDEPTNHLDLPSIEELEAALAQYKGAIVYISHDSYFAQKLGGEIVRITPE